MEAIPLEHRIKAFSSLGKHIKDILLGPGDKSFSRILSQVAAQNSWFTSDSVRKSLAAIVGLLDYEQLHSWLSPYIIPSLNEKPAKVGTIMAGNIPMVGFHDFLCILLTGNKISAKLSSKDSILINYLAQRLIETEPRFAANIEFNDSLPGDIEAIIATGSDNSARYFEYHYGDLPHIFRKNRNSLAIIHPGISDKELTDLGSDVFDYFGLGCRSVSMIYIPREFRLNQLALSWKDYSYVLDIEPYRKNYNYHRALYRTGGEAFFDTGYLLLKEAGAYSSPVSVLHYQYYTRPEAVIKELEMNSEKIQSVIGKDYNKFGTAQSPGLQDYADNVDTLKFLLSLSR